MPGQRGLIWLGVAALAGGAIMMLEILGGRLLAPIFGHSIYQWGALIGVVMAALALGYALGGLVGDRPGALGWLLGALAGACLGILLIPWVAPPLLPWLARLGPATGPVVATALLIAPPCLLLAVTGPILIRALARERIAAVAGRVYAVSTLGSIAGTFLTAFWAIPEIGTRASLLLTAVVVALAVALAGWAAGRRAAVLLLVVPAVAAAALPPGRAADASYSAESVHNIIEVVDTPTDRYLYLNYRAGFQSVLSKEGLLSEAMHDQFLLLPLLTDTRRLLFLGVAAGVSLNQLLQVYPRLELVGVELDPAVLEVARTQFGLAPGPRLELVADDARHYLTTPGPRFDAIAVDLYVTGHIPPHCATAEFFAALAERLTPDGVVLLNVVARHDPPVLLEPLAATVGRVFPSVYRYSPRGHLLIATRQPTELAALRARLAASGVPELVRPLATSAVAGLQTMSPPATTPVFTDDRSDLERRSFHVVHGGRR